MRNNYGSRKLVNYLDRMKRLSENAAVGTGWDAATLTRLAWKSTSEMGLSRPTLEKCIENSFKPYYEEGVVD